MAVGFPGTCALSDAGAAVSGYLKHLPNLLTALRLALAPAVALLLLEGDNRAAFGIFALAGLSDAADGFLAKRFGFVTRFGRYLDPAADKLLMLASYLTLSVMGVAPVWLTAIVIGRDLAIVLGVVWVVLRNLPVRVAPLFAGKLSTACQIVFVALALGLRALDLHWPLVLDIAAAITAIATLVSWAGYGQLLLQAISARRPDTKI